MQGEQAGCTQAGSRESGADELAQEPGTALLGQSQAAACGGEEVAGLWGRCWVLARMFPDCAAHRSLHLSEPPLLRLHPGDHHTDPILVYTTGRILLASLGFMRIEQKAPF